MRPRLLFAETRLLPIPLLLALAGITGCSVDSTIPPHPTPVSVTNNWQIQSGTSITPNQTGGAFLTGALLIHDTQVTGTFQSDITCVNAPQPLTFTGTYNPATGALSLQPAPTPFVQVNLTLPSDSYMATGTVAGAGNVCNIAFSGPAVGIEILPLNGTYAGALAAASPSTSTGTASLMVTQAGTPNANAQFPLAGTLQFTAGTCSASIPVTGTISGIGFTLAATGSTAATVSGSDVSGGTALTATTITFPNGPCNTGSSSSIAYAGTLTLQ